MSKVCKCGAECVLKVSQSPANPNRAFWSCDKSAGGCGAFCGWQDGKKSLGSTGGRATYQRRDRSPSPVRSKRPREESDDDQDVVVPATPPQKRARQEPDFQQMWATMLEKMCATAVATQTELQRVAAMLERHFGEGVTDEDLAAIPVPAPQSQQKK